jgi:hypothetical protein
MLPNKAETSSLSNSSPGDVSLRAFDTVTKGSFFDCQHRFLCLRGWSRSNGRLVRDEG